MVQSEQKPLLLSVSASLLAVTAWFIIVLGVRGAGYPMDQKLSYGWIPLLFLISLAGSTALRLGWKTGLGVAIANMLLLLLCCGVGGYFWDSSSDGQGAHLWRVIQLTEGVTPYRFTLEPMHSLSAEFTRRLSSSLPEFAFCHQAWAGVGLVLGQVESAKGFTIYLAILAVLFWRVALGAWLERPWQAWLGAFLAAGNPVIICQSLSFFTDSFVAIFSSLGVAYIVWVLGYRLQAQAAPFWLTPKFALMTLSFGAALWLLVCSKRSGVGAAIFIVLALIGGVLIAGSRLQSSWNKGLVLAVCAAMFSLALIVVHRTEWMAPLLKFTPYNVSEIKYRSSGSEIDDGASLFLGHKSKLEQLAISIFNKSRMHPDKPRWKWPWTVSGSELKEFQSLPAEIRIGGFGPWFGGAWLLTLVGLICFCWRGEKPQLIVLWIVTCLLTVSYFTSWWWPRWNPWFWLIPILVLLACWSSTSRLLRRYLALALALTLLVNVLLVGLPYARGAFLLRNLMSEQLALWQSLPQPLPILYDKDRDQALFRRLSEWGITTIDQTKEHFDYIVRARLISSGLAIYSNDLEDPAIQRLIVQSKALQERLKEFHVNNVIIEVGDDVPEGMERHYPFGLKMKKP